MFEDLKDEYRRTDNTMAKIDRKCKHRELHRILKIDQQTLNKPGGYIQVELCKPQKY